MTELLYRIEFKIEGPIMGWKRPARSHGNQHYDPPEQVSYKNYVGTICKTWMVKRRIPLLRGPVALGVQVFYPHPEKAVRRYFKDSVPDLDNIVKNIKDALKGIAWIDDRQVCHYLPSGKWYLPPDIFSEFDFALVTIREASRYDYPHYEFPKPRRNDGQVPKPAGVNGSAGKSGSRPDDPGAGGSGVAP